MKKALSILLVLALAFNFAACGSTNDTPSGTQDVPASNSETVESDNAGDQIFPAETVYIGVPVYDESDSEFILLKEYFEYLEDNLNIKFVYSEAIGDADDEIAFIENCSVNGCSAIFDTYDVIGSSVIDICAGHGMYYLGSPSDMGTEDSELYEQYKNNEYWLGGASTGGDASYERGYLTGKFVAESGYQNVVYTSGGAVMGIDLFVQMRNGFFAALEEYGFDGELTEITGFPSDDWYAQQATALADMSVDCIASGLGGITFWVQPIMSAERTDSLDLVALGGALDDVYYNAYRDGVVNYILVNNTQIRSYSIVCLLNALNGDLDVVKPDGVSRLLGIFSWEVTDVKDFEKVYEMSLNERILNVDDIRSMIKALNPDATFEANAKLVTEKDLDVIAARHAAY